MQFVILLIIFFLPQGQEREIQERIQEDAKDLEKMSNKQSLLLKKVTSLKLWNGPDTLAHSIPSTCIHVPAHPSCTSEKRESYLLHVLTD